MGLCKDAIRIQANQPRASRILRTCASELLDAQFEYYDSLPNYHPDWDAEVGKGTLDDLLSSFPAFMSSEPYRPELVRTINDYLEQRSSQMPQQAAPSPQAGRKQLRDSYFASFPDEKIKIRDVCWAAQQHVREWRRWLAGELKDGSTPDLAFRRVLTSGKRPAELQKNPRKPGWE